MRDAPQEIYALAKHSVATGSGVKRQAVRVSTSASVSVRPTTPGEEPQACGSTSLWVQRLENIGRDPWLSGVFSDAAGAIAAP